MGGAIIKPKRSVHIGEREYFIKQTTFFVYLQEETLAHFTKFFPRIEVWSAGDTISLETDQIYIIEKGLSSIMFVFVINCD